MAAVNSKLLASLKNGIDAAFLAHGITSKYLFLLETSNGTAVVFSEAGQSDLIKGILEAITNAFEEREEITETD